MEHEVTILEGSYDPNNRTFMDGIRFLDGKRFTAFSKEEAMCDAEVTIRKYDELLKKAKPENKSFNILKGKLLKESGNLMHPEFAKEFITKRINKKW